MATAAAAHSIGVHNLHAGVLGRGRAKNYSTTAAAAYNNRSRITDERTGQIHDYTHHPNKALFTGFFAPANGQAWAQDEASYWNAVEKKENRIDSQLARRFIITLPHELQAHPDGIKHARLALTEFAREEFQRRGYGVNLAIHPAHDHGDDRNLHAHMMVSVRKIERDGSWAKHKDPAEPDPDKLERWKERCAHHLNDKLERFGYDIRVDHRSLEARGETREAEIKLGPAAAALERKGIETDRGNINREIQARNAEREQRRQEVAEDRQAVKAIETLYGQKAEPNAPEPAYISAVERQQIEDREARAEAAKEAARDERRGSGIAHHLKEIMRALWSLGRTMGSELGNTIVNSDPDSMRAAARTEREANRKAAEDRAEQAAALYRKNAAEATQKQAQAERLQAYIFETSQNYQRQQQQAPAIGADLQRSVTPEQHQPPEREATKAKQPEQRQFIDRGQRPAPYHAIIQTPATARQEPPRGPESWIERQAVQETPAKVESYIDQKARQQREKGQTLADLLPRPTREQQLERDDDELGLDLNL